MDPKVDAAKGRAKEAAGALTGDEELKATGKAEQSSAERRQTIDDAADRAKSAVSDAAEKAQGAIDSAKDKMS
jgi:uncharacterized protein YjbJ (UPF0337 family)